MALPKKFAGKSRHFALTGIVKLTGIVNSTNFSTTQQLKN
jgi:hypothetical protein